MLFFFFSVLISLQFSMIIQFHLCSESLTVGMNYFRNQFENEYFTAYDKVFDSFDSMKLSENLLRGIYAYGKPSGFLLNIFFSC